MKILVTGNCARSHAMIARILDDPRIEKIYWAPGNAGLSSAKVEQIPITPDDVETLVTFAAEQQIDFTIVSQNFALYKGIVNEFMNAGLKIFGATSEAAELEWNKIWAKQFCVEHNIPSPTYRLVTGKEDILSTANTIELPIVVKYGGLAYGCGVSVCFTRSEVLEAVHNILSKELNTISGSYDSVMFEEYVTGREVSMHFLSDGNHSVFLGEARDYKKAFDVDSGPNTAGMGSYSPVKYVDEATCRRVIETIVQPTVEGMKRIGRPYRGVLYAGIMLTDNGPLLLEYNCRFGDSECQVILPRLESNFLDVLLSEDLRNIDVTFSDTYCATVCMCTKDYPESVGKQEHIIYGLDTVDSDVSVYHYGTRRIGESILTPTGRVLSVTAIGDSRQDVHDKIYRNIPRITWEGCRYRKDIGVLV